MLSGVSALLTYRQGRQGGIRHQMNRIFKLFMQYALATAVLQMWYDGIWDLKTYLSYIADFNVAAPYYFFVFFFQLLFITPMLLKWCSFCGSRRHSYLWHLISLVILGYISTLCIRYTFILPVHGGGKFLFGGTWLIVYYMGIVLEETSFFYRTDKQKYILLAVSGVAWIVWWWAKTCEYLPFDRYMKPYWGTGFNPPGINSIIFGFITLAFLYSLFSLMDSWRINIVTRLVRFLSFLGRNTIYTFLYHLLVRDILFRITPLAKYGYPVKWICVYCPMILVPPIIAWTVQKAMRFAKLRSQDSSAPVTTAL